MCSYSSFLTTIDPAYLAPSSAVGEQMSDLAKQLGRRIYLFRKQSKLTQAALAEKTKISNEFMSGIERGAKLPSLPTLERIAKVLGVNLKDLFNYDRATFRDIEPLSRQALDLASMVDRVSNQRRRQISRVIRILAEQINE